VAGDLKEIQMNHTTIELQPTTSAASRPARAGRRVASGLTAFVGLLLALAGIVLVSVHITARDDDGYYTADAQLHSGGYAIATEDVDLGGLVPQDLVGTIRLRADAQDGKPLFIGIADTADADRYLRGVKHSEVADFRDDGNSTYTELAGHAPAATPARQKFWIAQSQGAGQRTLDWDPASGNWTIVAMNADASRGLTVDADAGTKVGWLIWAGIGLTLVGLALIAAAVALWRGGRSPRQA
jgi:uncharacterized membrane protein